MCYRLFYDQFQFIGVSKQQLRQDMKEAFDDLQMVKHENALTEEDIRSALEAYDKEYYNFTISDIEALTDVRIERNKRNGRSQKEHLKRARAVQEVDYPGGTWRRKGAEDKKAQVYAWRQEHPEGRKADCHRDTGLDPKTIRLFFRPLFYHKFPLKTTSLLLSGEKVTQKHFHTATPSVQRCESALRP
jgi:hypothetical protein